ncbi:MAG: GWxTD domain-containing protein [Candidatus Aminicenantes bacterium]|nr:GWxTD domain-containing protein [Candidatus Aminicenantes bacterium]
MTQLRVALKSLRGAAGVLLALVLLASCGLNMMPTKDVWYTQHYSIMQDFEKTIYRTLSETGKKDFQDLFWAARDPASRTIFQERLSYIMNAFKRENSRQPWNTDRARIYILNGPPASIDIDQNSDWGMQLGQPATGGVDRSNEDVQAYRAEVWTYSVQKQYVKYVFAFIAPNEWKMSPAAVKGNQYIGALENYNKMVTFGTLNPETYKEALEALEKKK